MIVGKQGTLEQCDTEKCRVVLQQMMHADAEALARTGGSGAEQARRRCRRSDARASQPSSSTSCARLDSSDTASLRGVVHARELRALKTISSVS